ncbi:MAG TPA: NAD(P)H-hydrate epimerase [Phycisphaerae bacterium]|nr:NAD(P)H-hydrate epimerase [Phycisphaerae bacterium]HRW54569.1 NAD(P)H-hydrate epimerase [Phycisphaerae bacterium]
MEFSRFNPDEQTHLTRAQVREVDRRAIEDYGVPGVVLMENAGRHATDLIREVLVKFEPVTRRFIAVVCGRGNNGGDGFVIARHMSNAGNCVEIFLAAEPNDLKGDALINYDIARKMGIPINPFVSGKDIYVGLARLRNSILIVDAILGTGFHGAVRPPLDVAIQGLNDIQKMICAIDVPSGLDCDTGEPSNATIRAKITITFVARKIGFRSESAKAFLGDVKVADIGAPSAIIREIAPD